jgi:hypothetical protein
MEGLMHMTNVVPFARPKPAPHYLLLTTLIDPSAPLQEGDVVACRFANGQSVLFWIWWGPTGRDVNGRFVKKGSPREASLVGFMKYTAQDIRDGFTILGRVYAAHGPVERITPTAS